MTVTYVNCVQLMVSSTHQQDLNTGRHVRSSGRHQIFVKIKPYATVNQLGAKHALNASLTLAARNKWRPCAEALANLKYHLFADL
jgi:hypothetical protein